MTEDQATTSVPPPDAPVKRHRRGDVREDGKVFWAYTKNCVCGERWLTEEVFETYRKASNEYAKRRRQANIGQYREYDRKRRNANIEKIRARIMRWYQENRDERIVRMKEWRKANIEIEREKERKWYHENKEKVHASQRRRRKNNPVFALASELRTRISRSLRLLKVGKTSKLKDYLGCTPLELQSWIANQFLPGMSWENRSLWHIDHIVPLCLAKNAKEVYTLNHYTNLRPLWKADNLSKNKRLPDSLPEYIHPNIQSIYHNEAKH